MIVVPRRGANELTFCVVLLDLFPPDVGGGMSIGVGLRSLPARRPRLGVFHIADGPVPTGTIEVSIGEGAPSSVASDDKLAKWFLTKMVPDGLVGDARLLNGEQLRCLWSTMRSDSGVERLDMATIRDCVIADLVLDCVQDAHKQGRRCEELLELIKRAGDLTFRRRMISRIWELEASVGLSVIQSILLAMDEPSRSVEESASELAWALAAVRVALELRWLGAEGDVDIPVASGATRSVAGPIGKLFGARCWALRARFLCRLSTAMRAAVQQVMRESWSAQRPAGSKTARLFRSALRLDRPRTIAAHVRAISRGSARTIPEVEHPRSIARFLGRDPDPPVLRRLASALGEKGFHRALVRTLAAAYRLPPGNEIAAELAPLMTLLGE
ncbi:hypothetical protein WME98_12595 [Sorangium sp. So ce296]|uniref:hypothetical protein n=1 Tax=Sorangium sp. So ce296 TaxID=3133296 RepID=UPI003F6467A6